jgi:Type IV secretory system Conjugative DNA transfer
MSSQVLENWIFFKNRSLFAWVRHQTLPNSARHQPAVRSLWANDAITSTCHVQCAFAPNRIETAEHLSKLTGQTTVVKEQVTTSGRGRSTNGSRSTHEVSRPLFTPDEAMRMKGARKNAQGMITEPGNMVIYVAGYPAIMGLQPLYFRDSELTRRASISAESAQRNNSRTRWLPLADKTNRRAKTLFRLLRSGAINGIVRNHLRQRLSGYPAPRYTLSLSHLR